MITKYLVHVRTLWRHKYIHILHDLYMCICVLCVCMYVCMYVCVVLHVVFVCVFVCTCVY